LRNIVNILFCFLLSSSIGNAQSIKRSVICSFGSSSSNSSTSLSSTLGQPSNIGTISDGVNFIRQGFQQPIGCLGGPVYASVLATICDGDSVNVGNSVYFLDGIYIDSFITNLGCDSIITTTVQVNSIAFAGTPNSQSICLNTFGATQTYDLHDLILNEDLNGVWENAFGSVLNSSIVPYSYGFGSFAFLYTVDSDAPCPSVNVSVSLTINEAPIFNSVIVTNPTCNGNDDGSISVIIDLTGNYTYLWDNNNSNSLNDLLTSGSYSVTVTNEFGCVTNDSWTLENPEVLSVSYEILNSSCYESNDGSVDISVDGGTLPYTYIWNNNLTTEDLINLSPGNFSVTILDSLLCEVSENISISEPLELEFNPLTYAASCEEKPDGYIDIDPYGGTAPYTFLWSNGSINEDIDNLYTGNYNISLSDFNGCEKSLDLFVDYNSFDNCFFIPTLFTPNNDNIHDYWQIDGTELFDNISVQVFNRWGQLVFESVGYNEPWDGRSSGEDLPSSTYYYVIDLNDGKEPFNGPITIKR